MKREILQWMMFLMLFCNTSITFHINVAIISMVKQPQKTNVLDSNTTKAVICPNETLYWIKYETEETSILNEPSEKEETYDWTDYEKRTVLSAYHWLSWLAILPGGVLAQKFGSKIVLGYSLFFSAIMSSITPFVAQYGAGIVMWVRMIQGLISFITVPGGLTTIIGNWTTEEDRGKFIAKLAAGSYVAIGLGGYVFGYIGKYMNWKYIFHLTSLYGVVWTVLWYYLIHDSPEKHPTITNEEKNEILEARKNTITDEKIPIPWKNILTSAPVFSCSLMSVSILFNLFVLITFIPLYLNDIYGLDSKQAGVIVSLPQFIGLAGSISFGWFSDYVVKTRWLSLTNTRKLFGIAGNILSSVPLIIMAFTKCNILLIIACYILSNTTRTVSVFGVEPTIIDRSPKFCGIIHGITGTLIELTTLAFSGGISYLSHILPTEEFWKVLYLSTAALGLVSSIVFLIWGSAETQSWNKGSRINTERRQYG